jgi:hypothetical protein
MIFLSDGARCKKIGIDEARQSIVTAIEALVGDQPRVRVLDNAVDSAQPGAGSDSV